MLERPPSRFNDSTRKSAKPSKARVDISLEKTLYIMSMTLSKKLPAGGLLLRCAYLTQSLGRSIIRAIKYRKTQQRSFRETGPFRVSSTRGIEPIQFIDPHEERNPIAGFGFGRRACHGRYFAEQSLHLNIAACLACSNVTAALDRIGRPISIEVRSSPGILTYPTEFEFKIEPRSEKHVELIKARGQDVQWDPSDAGHLDSFGDSA